MQKDISHNSNLSIGGRILDDVFLPFYTFLSIFSIIIMFYFVNQEKWNKLTEKREEERKTLI